MPRRDQASWLSLLGQVPITFILTFVVTAATFYAVTQYRLGDYDRRLTAAEAKLEQSGPAVSAKLDTEAQQRAAIRTEFMQNANKTTEILGQISSRLAVSETKQEATNKALDTTNQTLGKIADQLQQLNAAGRAVRR